MMKRLFITVVIGCAGILAGCGSSKSITPQPNSQNVYTVVVTPAQMTLNAGDFASISATVFLSVDNGTPKAVSPQPAIEFSSEAGVTVSPAGEVCAGLWDAKFETCTAAPTLPAGFVTVTAFDAAHNVKGTMQVSVHLRAARITLSSDWGGLTCISQNHLAQYKAKAVDANGNTILSCTDPISPGTPGCIHDNDYTWSTENTAIAQANSFGNVSAHNPGVTSVFATLDGTVSEPVAFVTCPPTSIVLTTSAFIAGTNPAQPFSTDDLTLNRGEQRYVNATMVDINHNPVVTSPLTYVLSNPLTASLTPTLPLSSVLTAKTAGRFTIMAACDPPSCNPSVADFVLPTNPPTPVTAEAAGFNHPIYSNLVGITVQGSTSSSVLVTGTTLSDGTTAARRLLVYNSESMSLTQTIALGNIPNSLAVAPNGVNTYLGSCDGLVVVNLNSGQSSLQTFPVAGQPSTAVVSGKVLGVSPDSRFVVVSDNSCPSVPGNPASSPNHLVYLVDTTGTKSAALFRIPNITSVTFAADGTNIWIGGDAGVYVFQADTFVLVPTNTNASLNVTSMAWMPDGQSYFASGDNMIDYRACENQVIQTFATPVSTVPGGLATTEIGSAVIGEITGVPHLLGLDSDQWFDYSVTTSAQVLNQSVPALSIPPLTVNANGGNVCRSTVTVNTPVQTAIAAGLPCTAQQVSFAPKLQEAFITGVDPACATPEPVIHGYAPFGAPPAFGGAPAEFTLATTNLPAVPLSGPVVPLSGGVLSDGRKLFYGSFDARGTVLHRIDLADSTGAPGTHTEDAAVKVSVVPNFVAVVPK